MASFQAIIGWKRSRMRENKNYRSVPTTFVIQNSKKKSKKIKKNEKTLLWYHFKPKLFGKCQESEKIKIIVSFRPYLTHNLKFQKNCKKNQKIKKCQYGFI